MRPAGWHHSEETRAKLRALQTGRTLSEETRAKIGAAGKGKHHSQETLIKMRVSALGRRQTAEARTKMSAYHCRPEVVAKLRAVWLGRRHSPESLAKLSASQIERLRSPEALAKMREAQLGKRASPETRVKMVAAHRKPEVLARTIEARARQVTPFRDTKPEVAVQTLLRDYGVEFTKHEHIPGLNHRWDIVVESLHTLIEVDGCYWHGCPICKIPRARINKNDVPCVTYAVAAGWTVIRIWECEIKAGDFSKLTKMLGANKTDEEERKNENG